MINSSEIIPLFPTTIMTNNINRQFTLDELNCILDYNDKLNPITGNITSKDMYVLDNDKLYDIKLFCQNILNDYFFKIYDPVNPNDVKLVITQSWLNFTMHEQHHEKHKHYNSFLSGIIYINAFKDKDGIIFSKADSDFNWQIQSKNQNPFNSKDFFLSVGIGDIVIFPSNMYHSTMQTNNDYIRISLGFSSFIDGTIGYLDGKIEGINKLKINI
jgi:hypothetical protein